MSRLHDRLLLLCELRHCCPLGLALRWHRSRGYDPYPEPETASDYLNIPEATAAYVAELWDGEAPRHALSILKSWGGFHGAGRKLTR